MVFLQWLHSCHNSFFLCGRYCDTISKSTCCVALGLHANIKRAWCFYHNNICMMSVDAEWFEIQTCCSEGCEYLYFDSLVHIWSVIPDLIYMMIASDKTKSHLLPLNLSGKTIFNVLEFFAQVSKVIAMRLEVLRLPCDSARTQRDKEQRFRSSGCQIGARSGERIQGNSWCAGGMIKMSLQRRDSGLAVVCLR